MIMGSILLPSTSRGRGDSKRASLGEGGLGRTIFREVNLGYLKGLGFKMSLKSLFGILLGLELCIVLLQMFADATKSVLGLLGLPGRPSPGGLSVPDLSMHRSRAPPRLMSLLTAAVTRRVTNAARSRKGPSWSRIGSQSWGRRCLDTQFTEWTR